RQFEQRRHARHHEDTCGHHGCRVNQCGNRGRAFHRIRQPDVQRELCRFTHRADEQADAGNGQQCPVSTWQRQLVQFCLLGEDFCVVHGASVCQQQTDTENEAEVTDTVDQEGLHVGEDCGRLFVPETDQQIGHQAHCFPAEEQLQEVVAHDEHQHCKREQRDVREETVIAFVFFHVADGVDVHHQRHEGHDAHHHRGQAVDQETDFHFHTGHCQPGIDATVIGGTVL